ncbi:DNA primase/helicase [Xanthomonas phage Xoo-sp13]|nr:DNA primase/helicase [Xanthomonas phage Xoo-sp13]
MNSNEQKLTIETLLSSKEVFSRCISILDSEFFDPEYRPTVQYITEYYEKYHNIPSMKAVVAKFGEMDYEERGIIPVSEEQSTCDEIELFCKQQALFNAIQDSIPKVMSRDTQQFSTIHQAIQAALEIGLAKDVGVDMFVDPEERLRRLVDHQIYEPTGILGIDEPLGGGLARKQFTLFSANSGGGKSIMLANIGANYAARGYRVLLLSLELSEDMIFLRNSAIMSGTKAMEWKDNIPLISQRLMEQSTNGGSFLIKRIPNGSTANDIRSYLKHYELTFNAKPDVIIVDYLDLMTPNGGVKSMGVSEQDKLKSEQLSEVAYVYDAIMLSASQQNREALRMPSPDQGVIAGGITKVNTVDNYISIFMDPAMRVQGDMIIHFLKTRSSSAVGTSKQLKFNADTLQITDGIVKTTNIMAIPSKKKKLMNSLTTNLKLPGGDNYTADDSQEDNDGQALLSYDDDKPSSKPTPVATSTPLDAVPWEEDTPEPVPPKKVIKKKLSNGNGLEDLMSSINYLGDSK